MSRKSVSIRGDHSTQAAERATEIAPYNIAIRRTADKAVHYVANNTEVIYTSKAYLLDGRYMLEGKGSEPILKWFRETAVTY